MRYQAELAGHLIKDGRQQFLDEEAVAFLDARRAKNPVAIIQQSKDEEIETLRAKNAALLERVAALAEWKAENAQAIAEANQTRILLDASERDKKLLEGFVADAKAEISILSGEKAAAEEKRLKRLKRPLTSSQRPRNEFGLWRSTQQPARHMQPCQPSKGFS